MPRPFTVRTLLDGREIARQDCVGARIGAVVQGLADTCPYPGFNEIMVVLNHAGPVRRRKYVNAFATNFFTYFGRGLGFIWGCVVMVTVLAIIMEAVKRWA